MTDILLKELSKKLDTLIALTATQGMDEKAKIKILHGLGFSNVEIGNLMGISEGSVRNKMKK